MATTEKKLSLVIESDKAKKGAGEVKKSLEEVSAKASKLQKDLETIADLMQKTGTKPKGNIAKPLTEATSETQKLIKARKELMSATERQNKTLKDAAERNSEVNKQTREGIVLENQKRTSEAQSIKLSQLLTAEGRKRWEAIEAQRVAVKAYQSAYTQAKQEELGLTKKVSEAQKVEEELKRKQARSEAMLQAAKKGTLETTLKAQKAEKESIEAIKASVNAMSQAEKEAKAYDKAMEKLGNTLLAEQARTKALATDLGRESVQVQENRRQKEELARSIERLNLMRSEEGKKLIQTRVQAEQLAKKYREEITGAQSTLRTSTDGLSSSFSALTTAMSGVAVYFSVGGIVRTADAYTNLSNRLKSVSDSTVNVTEETRKMLAMSIENRSTLDATMDVYSKLIRANKSLGMSQADVVQITDTVSKAVAMSGASAAGAEGAMMQFGQAMSNNFTAAGQELNSILEQTPALAEAMANGLRKVTGDSTITTASLKKMGEQGELSSELMAKALKAASEDVAEAFKNTDATISSAMKNLRDSFTLAIGGLDDLYEVSESVTEIFKDINQELPDLQANIAGVATSLATFIGAAGLGGMITLLNPVGRMILLVSGAISTLAGAIAAASVKQRAYIKEIEDIESANLAVADSTQKRIDLLEALNVLQLASKNDTLLADIEAVNLKIDDARDKLKAVEEAGISAGSDSSLVQRAEEYNEKLRNAQRLLDGLTASRAALEGQYIETLIPTDINYVNTFNDGVSALTETLRGVKLPIDKAIKAQTEWQTTSQKLDNQLKEVIDSSKLMEDQEEAQRVVSEKTNQVQKAKQQLYIDYLLILERLENSKASEISDEEKRRNSIQQTIQVLHNEVEAIRNGAEFYKVFQEQREAASMLGYEDVSLVPEDELEALKAAIKLIRERKDVLEQASLVKAFKDSSKDINAEVKALKQGKDAYEDYLYRVQAIQMLGGIIPEGESGKVDKLAASLKEAAESAKDYQDALQREDNLKEFNEEYEALAKGEREYQDLLLKRRAMQMLVVDEYKGNEEAVDSLIDKLKEFAKFKIDPFEQMTDSIKSGISSFQTLAEVTGSGGKEMEVAMAAVNAAQAVYAVLNQSGGDPYTAFARMAAMAASVAQLGQSVGNLSGGVSSADRQASQGTGSVLGDLDAKSESITNSIEYSADALEDLVGINTGILDAMETLANAIQGATNLIARDVDYSGIATGLGASTGMKLSEDLGAGAGKLFDSVFMNLTGGLTGDLFETLGGALGSILGGAFGSSKVTDEGIRVLGGTLSEIIQGSSAQAYQNVKTSRAWGLSTSNSTNYRDVSDAVEQQFDLTFESIFSAVEAAATNLGYASEGVQKSLDEFVVDTQQISLKGLSSEEINEELSAVFSKTFDELSASVIPLTTELQRAGEGAGETLSRLATNFTVVGEVIDQLRLDALTGSTDDIIKLSTAFTEMAGGASALASQMTDFVSTFATEERQLEILQGNLVDALGEQDKAILESREGVYDYIDAIKGSSQAELQRVSNILSLTGSLDEYFSLLEDVSEATTDVSELEERLNSVRGTSNTLLETRIRREEELAQATSNTAKMYLKAIHLAEDLAEASDLESALDLYSGAISQTTATLTTANTALSILGMQGKTYINALKDLEQLDNQDLVFLADNLGISLGKLGEYIEDLKKASDTVTGTGDQGVVDNARARVNSLQNSIQDISDEFFGGVIPNVADVIDEVFNRTVSQSGNNADNEQALLDALSPYSDRIILLENAAGKSITDITNLQDAYLTAMEQAFGQTIDASVLTSDKLLELNNYSNQVRGGNLLVEEVEAWSEGLEAGTIAVDKLKELMSQDQGAQLFQEFQQIQDILQGFSPATDSTIPKLEELKNALLNLPDAQEALNTALASLEETTNDTTDSVNDLSEALSKRNSLENTLLSLQGNTQELRNRELESLKEIYGWQSQRLVSLQEEVWLVQDFQSTVGSVRDALDLDTISLEDALSSLSSFGNDADSILNTFAELSQSDLKEYFESTGVTVGSLSSNLNVLIDSLESVDDSVDDLLTQAKEAADSAFSDLSNSIEAEKDLLKDSYESQSESISNSIDTVSDSVSNLESVSNKLKDALRNITTESQSLTISRLRGGQEALRGMISAGGVDDEDVLSNVISTLSTDNRSVFGTYKDYVKSQSSSLSLISELGSITEDQLTTEEKTLNNLKEQLETLEKTYNLSVEDLDRTLESYQQQLDALNGINNSVLSVVQAVANMESSLASLSKVSEEPFESLNRTQDDELQSIKDTGIGWAQGYQGASTSQIMKDILTAKAIETGFVDGSHFNGADRIPFDNYRANLHKGEMVLTAPIADKIREMAGRADSGVGYQSDERVVSLLGRLIERVDASSYNMNKKLIKLEKMEQIIAKWDNTGQPQTRNY